MTLENAMEHCACCTDPIPAGDEHANELGDVCPYCAQPNHRRCTVSSTVVHGEAAE